MICCFSENTSVHVLGTVNRSSLTMILAKNIFRLAERQTERGLQQPFASRVVQVNFHLMKLFHVGDDLVEQFAARSSRDGSG